MPGKAPPYELAIAPNIAARWEKTREVIGPQAGVGPAWQILAEGGAVRDIYYVDGNTGKGNDDNDGRDPTLPLATIGAAVAKVATGDTILVSPIESTAHNAEGAYEENVDTPDSTEANYVSLIGISASGDQVIWKPAVQTDACLDIMAKGWRVSGFRFVAPTSSYSIFLHRSLTNMQGGSNTLIDNCRFFGLGGGGGIDFQGAPFEVSILDCEFSFHTAGPAITCSDSGVATAYRCRIERCLFHENLHHIHMALYAPRGFNSSLIKDCIFAAGASGVASTARIVLTGGQSNMVVHNFLDDTADYATAYIGGTNDLWNNYNDHDAAQPDPGVPDS